MTWQTAGSLAVLALADATSLGTLLVPVWLLIDPTLRGRLVVAYLGTLALCYAAAGALVLAAMRVGWHRHATVGGGEAWTWGGLIAGVAAVAAGLVIDARGPTTSSRRRVARWRQRTLRPRDGSGMARLALVAAALEVAGMVPYLTGLSLIDRSGVPLPVGAGVVAAYALVMVAPALALVGLRRIAGPRALAVLQRLRDLVERHAHALAATLLLTAGGLLALNCAIALGLLRR